MTSSLASSIMTPQSFSLATVSGSIRIFQLSSGTSPQPFLHLGDVVADAGRAPHVVDGVLVAGIVGLQTLGDVGPHVDEVGQLRLVELLEHAGLDLAGEEVRRRHDHVVARLAGEQLGLENLVGVEDVVDDLDPGFLGEILQDLGIDIVRPVVDVDDFVLRCDRKGARREDRSKACRGQETLHVFTSSPVDPAGALRLPMNSQDTCQCRRPLGFESAGSPAIRLPRVPIL